MRLVRLFQFAPLFLVIFLLSCTRQVENSKFSMGFAIRDKNHLMTVSPTDIKHLVISIQGAGIAREVIEWDGHAEEGLPPLVIYRPDFPEGPKLIQVAAYVQGSNGSFFAYGDEEFSVGKGENYAFIEAESIGSSSGLQGHVFGRYMSTPYLSGAVDGEISVNGQPFMPVIQTEIIGGWFNFFVIDGIQLRYTHKESGTLLFDSLAMSVPDPTFATEPEVLVNGNSYKNGDDKTFQTFIPRFYRNNGSHAADTSKEDGLGIFMWGYFGPDVVSQVACSNAVSASSSYSSTDHELFDYQSPASLLQWDFTGTYDGAKVSRIGTAGTGSCGSTEWDDYINWHPGSLEDSGMNSSMKFVPPFVPNMGKRIDSSKGSQLDVYFNMLPEVWDTVTPGALKGVEGFRINDGSTVDFDPNDAEAGPTCDEALDYGFEHFDEQPDTACLGGCILSDLTNDPSKDEHIMVCPFYADDENGKRVYSRNFGRTFVAADPTPVVMTLAMDPVTNNVLLPSNTYAGRNCVQVDVTLDVVANYDITISPVITSTIGSPTVTYFDITDTTCSGAAYTSFDIPEGDLGVSFRMLTSGLGSINFDVSISTLPATASVAISPPTSFNTSSGYMLKANGSPIPSCGGAGTVDLYDFIGNPVTNDLGHAIVISSSNTDIGNSSCPGSPSAFEISDGTGSVDAFNSDLSTGNFANLTTADVNVGFDPSWSTFNW